MRPGNTRTVEVCVPSGAKEKGGVWFRTSKGGRQGQYSVTMFAGPPLTMGQSKELIQMDLGRFFLSSNTLVHFKF